VADTAAGTARGQLREAYRSLSAGAARPWLREMVVLAAFLVAGVAATWPLASYISGRLPASRDVASYVWALWWVAHQVINLHDPWSTTYLAAPAGLQLGYDTLMPLVGVVMTPVTLAFGPSAAYNLLIIVLPGLACYAMYRAARLWLRTMAGAVAAGAFFGLSAMLTFQAWYHVNIAYGTAFLPLTLEAAVRLRRGPSIGRAASLGVVLGACALVNQESAVMAVIVAVLALVSWLAGAGAVRIAVTRLRFLGAAAVTAAVVASPQLVAMVQQASAGGATATASQLGYSTWVADLAGEFAPSPRLVGYGLADLGRIYTSPTRLETMDTFGVVLSAVAVLGLVVSARRRSARLLALLWAGGAALALGPVLSAGGRTYVPVAQTWERIRVSAVMPYTWFIRVPGLSVFREADRLALLGLVGAALLAGAGVEWLVLRPLWPLVIAVAVLGGLEAGWPGSPAGLPAMPTTLATLDRPIAADRSGSIVVDVPYGLDNEPFYGAEPDARAILLATADGHPRAVCYTSWVPEQTIAATERHAFYVGLNAAQQGRPVTSAQEAAARADLRTLHIGWVLVWLPRPGRDLAGYLSATGFRFAYRADGASVYRPAGG
jgi:hypothetical protein